MLPLSDIANLSNTVDADWCSPIADAAATAWGYRPGSARYWRSSASHVFVVLDKDGTRREAFLRLVPASRFARTSVETVAALMSRLAEANLGIARALPSSAGNLVETIGSGGLRVHAMLVANAPGVQIDVDDLTPERARAWGAALARLHRDGDAVAATLGLPDGLARIRRALDGRYLDESVAEWAGALRSRLAGQPRDPDCYGLVHGDFELDNMAWTGHTPTAYDLDEAERSWFAADIAYAVRDLVPEPEALLERPPAMLDAFLGGYRQERPSAVLDHGQLALFTAVNAVRSLARLGPVLAEDPTAGQRLMAETPTGPRPLRTVLEAYAERQRSVIARLVPLVGDVGDVGPVTTRPRRGRATPP